MIIKERNHFAGCAFFLSSLLFANQKKQLHLRAFFHDICQRVIRGLANPYWIKSAILITSIISILGTFLPSLTGNCLLVIYGTFF